MTSFSVDYIDNLAKLIDASLVRDEETGTRYAILFIDEFPRQLKNQYERNGGEVFCPRYGEYWVFV